MSAVLQASFSMSLPSHSGLNNKYGCNDVVEANCYVVDMGELIVSRYVAESITTNAGCFGHVGLWQLCTNCVQNAHSFVCSGAQGLVILAMPMCLH